ncbi:hypothetical protein [Nocardioides ganghwensis]|uniref:Uncharacterized protein n=1 Tax=Nocardioides ganghwensis TaxID=252230 RepID=A0A4Q2S8R8_9ACTN|nr:hypothetical protein [Nocardioides ganghwensis]MBD3947417.1 hypothetical protein [Nocardioides ganghwensis]RYB99932.1 hypothetical protein EUA07_15720 [Nocardioides ganghwensis]
MRTATVLARTLVGLGVVVVAVVPTAAAAEQWTHRDATGDVVQLTWDYESVKTTTELPDDVSTDVRRLTITHAPHELRISMRVQDSVRGTRTVELYVRTAEGRRFEVWASAFRARVFDAPSIVATPSHEHVRCSGQSATLDPDTDKVSVTLPRRCLGDPRWVQVAAAFTTESESESDADFFRNTDDALREGVNDRLLMSRRVRVG